MHKLVIYIACNPITTFPKENNPFSLSHHSPTTLITLKDHSKIAMIVWNTLLRTILACLAERS